MTIKHIVTLHIEPADWTADEYGNPECEVRDLFVPCIRAIKAMRDCRLGDAKRAAEEAGLKSAAGCKTLRLAVSDAGLGRLFVLCRESQGQANRWLSTPDAGGKAPIVFTIDDVASFHGAIISEV